MSTQIDTAYVNQFKANFTDLAQQRTARLRGAVMVDTQRGELAYHDQVGSVEPVERVSRHADTPFTEVPFARRACAMVDWEMGEIVDKQDTIRQLTDPQSAYARAFGYGMARRMDRSIIQAMFADARTGKTGSGTTSFPSGQQIAVDYVETGSTTNSSITIGKLRRAKELLMDAEVSEGEDLYIACTQRELNALLRTTEVGSSDYNSVKALVDGDVGAFMGFKFIRLPAARFDLNGSGHRRIPCWHKEGILFNAGQEPNVEAAPDPTKAFNTRVYASATFGATRLEEARVVEIICSTSVF